MITPATTTKRFLRVMSSRAICSIKTVGIALAAALVVLPFALAEYNLLQKKLFDVWTLIAFLWVVVAAGSVFSRPRAAPKTVVVLVIVFASMPAILWLIGIRWIPFIRVPAQVSINQREFTDAKLYKGINGTLLVALDDSELQLYLPQRREVMLCDSYLFHGYWLMGRLEEGKDQYFCMSSKKQEINLDLRVSKQEVAFNRPSANGAERVVVRY